MSERKPLDAATVTEIHRAVLTYKRLVQSVADFLEVPADETEPVIINTASTWFEAYE